MPYIQYCERCNVQLLIEYPSEGGPAAGEWVGCETCGYEFRVCPADQPGAAGSGAIAKFVSELKSAFNFRGKLGLYGCFAVAFLITFMAGALLGDRLFWVFGLLVRKALRMAGVI